MSSSSGERGNRTKTGGLVSFESIEEQSTADKARAALKSISQGFVKALGQPFAKPLARFRARNEPPSVYFAYAQEVVQKLDTLFTSDEEKIQKWKSASAFYFLTGPQKQREQVIKAYQKQVKHCLDSLDGLIAALESPDNVLNDEYEALRNALTKRKESFAELHHFLQGALSPDEPLQLSDENLFKVTCQGYNEPGDFNAAVKNIKAREPNLNAEKVLVGALSETPSTKPQLGTYTGEKQAPQRIYTVAKGAAGRDPDVAEPVTAHFYETQGVKPKEASGEPVFRMQFAKDLPTHNDTKQGDLRLATAMAMATNMLARLDTKPSPNKPLYLFGQNKQDMVLLYTCLEYSMKQIGLSPKHCIKGDIEFQKMQKEFGAFMNNDVKKWHDQYQKNIAAQYGFGGAKATAGYAAEKATTLESHTKTLAKDLDKVEETIRTKLEKLKGHSSKADSSLLASESEEEAEEDSTDLDDSGKESPLSRPGHK